MEDRNAQAYRDTQSIDQTFPLLYNPIAQSFATSYPHYDYTSNPNGPCDIVYVSSFSVPSYTL